MIAGWQMRKFKFMPKQPIWHPPIHVSKNPIPATAAIKEVGYKVVHRLREYRALLILDGERVNAT